MSAPAGLSPELVKFVDALKPTNEYVVAWSLLFMVSRFVLFRKLSADFSNRVVSIIHALVAIVLSYKALDMKDPFGNIGGANTGAQAFCMTVSAAYFLYDFVCCLFIDLDLMGNIHHIATMAGLFVGLYEGKSGTELVGCLLLMELSNPFMHTRILLRELKLGEKPFALVNDVAFAVTFFVCRLIIGPVLVYKTVASKESPHLVKAGGIGILVVSLVWFQKIASMVVRKLSRGEKADRGRKAK